jgi:hypothetical protein
MPLVNVISDVIHSGSKFVTSDETELRLLDCTRSSECDEPDYDILLG